jgi:two-component system chemotaxis response regulator CheB
VLVVQHMPAGFTERFAARLDSVSKLSVCEAADGLPLQTGRAYIARGDRHLRVQRTSDGLVCRLGDDAVMSGHRPSVDALFASVAGVAGALAIGVILTGMGRDGTTGLQRIRQSGGRTIGQSEASSLVYGMPRAAFEADAVMEQVALEAVAGRVAAALLLMRHAA